MKGENFNGNNFAINALEAGAKYAIIDDESIPKANSAYLDRLILVENSLKLLQELANFHRKQFSIPILAITGTNGKTTTKELVSIVLSKKYSLFATKGNFNNHIGVPLTILGLNDTHEFAIIEMGASAPTEIKTLCEIVEPTYGIITNVGKAHLQGFGSFEGVVSTKGELYDYLANNSGRVFYNIKDNNILSMLAGREIERIPYGDTAIIHKLGDSIYLELAISTGEIVKTNLVGDYNINNVLAAMAVASFFGMSNEDIIEAISLYAPVNNRSQLFEGHENKIVIDAYNANPTSMLASVSNFVSIKVDNKVMVLGDMRELGNDSLVEHKKTLELIDFDDFKCVYLVGAEFTKAVIELDLLRISNLATFADSDKLYDFLREYPLKDSFILVKGSRGIKLERIFDLIKF